MKKSLFLWAWILLSAPSCFAQANMPTERLVQTLNFEQALHLNYFNRSGSLWSFERTQLSTAAPNASGSMSTLLRQYSLAYEGRLSPKWYGGLVARYRVQPQGGNAFLVGLQAAHSSSIKSVEFFKQIGVEQINYSSSNRPNQGRISGQVALMRSFGLGRRSQLRPSLSYQFFSLFNWEASSLPTNKRRIDQTLFRAEVAYIWRNSTSVGLYFSHNTDYYFALAQFDADGQLLKPDRRLNLLSPTFGLRLHYLLKKAPQEASLRHLPY